MTFERPVEGLTIAQPRRGFRYGSEAFWLVGFALEAGWPDTALDLGTGSGVMACLLARQGIPSVGVELRSEWSTCWDLSLSKSEPLTKLQLVQGDVASFETDRLVGLVVSNPPFFAKGTGPVSPDAWKAAARTESCSRLADFIDCAVRSIHSSGRACFVVPRERAPEVVHPAAFVSRYVRVGSRRALIELRPGAGADAAMQQVTESSRRVSEWYDRALGSDGCG